MTGIYYIINLVNRKRYIGLSKNIEKRYVKINHDWTRHHNKHLARAAKKYGNENFRFVLVEECEENQLKKQEMFHYSMFPKYMLYNEARAGLGGWPKMMFPAEKRKKMSDGVKRWHAANPQTGEKNSFYGKQHKESSKQMQRDAGIRSAKDKQRDAHGRFIARSWF